MRRIFIAALAAMICLTGCTARPQPQSKPESSIPEEVEVTSTEGGITAPPIREPVIVTDRETQQPSEPEHETVAVIPEESEESQETAEVHTEKYSVMLAEYDNAYLGLPQQDKVYTFRDIEETTEINGEKYYGVACYDEYEGQLYYMCDFYITEDGAQVYRYEIGTGDLISLPESAAFPRMDPSAQTVEEIFAVANELYGYFDVGSLPCDDSATITVDFDGGKMTFWRVTDPRIDTKDELLDALSGYFSADIINSLMDSELYRTGADGMLYTTGGARGTDNTHIGTLYEMTVLRGDTAEFSAVSEYLNDDGSTYTEEYIYNAVKQDGRWFFTNFKLPY